MVSLTRRETVNIALLITLLFYCVVNISNWLSGWICLLSSQACDKSLEVIFVILTMIGILKLSGAFKKRQD